MKFIKIIILPIIMMSFMGFNISFAQTADYIDNFAPIQMDIPCIEAQYDLRFGSRDYALFGDVMKLQLFLYQNEIMYYPPTGYFGPITQSSLARYQSLRNLQPTGVFDYQTRYVLGEETCGRAPVIPMPSYINQNIQQNTGQNNQTNNVDLSNLFNNSNNQNQINPQQNQNSTQSSTYNVSGNMFSQ